MLTVCSFSLAIDRSKAIPVAVMTGIKRSTHQANTLVDSEYVARPNSSMSDGPLKMNPSELPKARVRTQACPNDGFSARQIVEKIRAKKGEKLPTALQ